MDVADVRGDLEALYRERFERFARMARAVSASDEAAREAVQEGFARAYGGADAFRGDGSLEGWVWRSILHVMIDQARKPKHLPLTDQFEPVLPDPEADPDLHAALLRLPPRRRMVVFLRFYADLSLRDIATALDLNEGTVSATLTRPKAQLRESLTESEVSP
jgi:RNA polymerase sigma factor (sigma-70 family)